MPTLQNQNLMDVDWTRIPAPVDDGGCAHLRGMALPDLSLRATDGSDVNLAALKERTVIFAYPRTGRPDEPAPVDDWDLIPGARGCTPQSCSFRDLFAELQRAGVRQVFGLSTQDTAYQRELVQRLHLPFPVLSDEKLALTHALRLPTMTVASMILLKRFALISDGARVVHVLYPVFPPDRNAADVLAWVRANPPR